MEIEDEYTLPASQAVVWRLLNDTDILRECIPGCESLEKTGENAMEAVVVVKIGPIKARFQGAVTLIDLVPPQSYSIVGEGKGGVAGFAKGRADILLQEVEQGTLLKYKVHTQIGGKIAQLGNRLILSTSRMLSREFFDRFSRKVSEAAQQA